MKKIIAIMLTVALALPLAACGVGKRGEKGAEEEIMTISIGTAYDFISLSNVDDKGGSAESIDLIVSLDDVEARGTFTVNITGNNGFSASFLMEVESDGGMIRFDNPTHQYFDCSVKNGKITEIRRLDDGKVSITFARTD